MNRFCVPQNGNAAASLSVAEQYVSAFSQLAKESNTILLPNNSGDISGMVTQVIQHQETCSLCAARANSPPPFPHSGYEHLQHANQAQTCNGAGGGGGGGARRGDGRAEQSGVAVSLTEVVNELRAAGVCLLLQL